MQSLGIQHIMDVGRSLSLQNRQREIRETFPYNSESDLVGVEQSVKELVGHVVEIIAYKWFLYPGWAVLVKPP